MKPYDALLMLILVISIGIISVIIHNKNTNKINEYQNEINGKSSITNSASYKFVSMTLNKNKDRSCKRMNVYKENYPFCPQFQMK